jgi:lactoylglutathione lyase
MIANTTNSLESLAADLKSDIADATVEITAFPSGGAMVDVRRRDRRAFALAYFPAHGYAVDEIHADDGFVNGYRFVYPDLNSAAEKLKELASDRSIGPQPAQEVALNLVVIQSRDLEAARRFYDCLGLVFQREQHGNGPEHYAAQVGTTVFELYPCRDGACAAQLRLGFSVSKLGPALSALRAQSAQILREPNDEPWGRTSVVQDPDGNRVELTERR